MKRYVRDTLIDFDQLTDEKREKIEALCQEFDALGYIDARTQIGPSQWGRTSKRQRDRLSDTALKAFRIEDQIKELLKPEDQLQQEAREAQIKELESRKLQLTRQLELFKDLYAKKLRSNRRNQAKVTVELVEMELQEVNQKLQKLK